MPHDKLLCVVAFATDLGWIALVGSGRTVVQLAFGHRSKADALAAIDPKIRTRAVNWYPSLVRRLTEYAHGAPDDFRDIQLNLDHLTPFGRRVVKHCRAIGYGSTLSYGELAAASGAARAARAVGNTMAGNRFMPVVPCHRVVHSGGDMGRTSHSGRLRRMLRRLEQDGRPPASVRRPKRAQPRPVRASG